MENVYIIPCDPTQPTVVVEVEESLVVSGETYYLTFTGETIPSCYTIGLTTIDPPVDTIGTLTQYNDCLSCLQSNGFSFIVTACTVSDLGGLVNSSQFNEFPINKFYTLCSNAGEFEGCLCFEVLGISSESYPFIFGISGPYSDCNCQEPPRSAGTESTVCVICNDVISGETITVVSPPHPVWTDSRGIAVTQLNAIALGGMNGLNN
jgi:hypothetical protein